MGDEQKPTKTAQEHSKTVWFYPAIEAGGWPGHEVLRTGALLRVATAFEAAAHSLAEIAANTWHGSHALAEIAANTWHGSHAQSAQLNKKSEDLRKARAENRRLKKALAERNKESVSS